jgi:hypothetical protein
MGDIADMQANSNIGRLQNFNLDYNPMGFEDYEESWQDSVEEADVSDDDEYSSAPVELTDIPTSSTNSSRPRTVAAGFRLYSGARKNPRAAQLGKMTVMFRDGTIYNYYDVSPDEWISFRNSISKGAPWLNKGFPNGKQQVDGLFVGKRQGPADLTGISESARASIYRIARTAQVQFATKRKVSVKKYNAADTSKTSRESYSNVISNRGARAAGLRRKGYGSNPYKP